MRERATAKEILDGTVADSALLSDSFREVWGVNRYFGGMTVLRHHLNRWRNAGRVTLLDVAAGTGEVALSLAEWFRANGTAAAVTLLDNHPQVLAIARKRWADRPEVWVEEGDARRLPFAAGQFDLVTCNLALHHFDPEDAVQLLREVDRVSRLGWVVCDLERHLAAYVAARLLALTIWRNPITRHDGPVSVRRAYRQDEAIDLVRRAGIKARVCRHLPFRLALVGMS